MSHTDLHAKTEAHAAKQKTYDNIKKGPATPTKENESEDQELGIKIQTLLKGGDSEIHVRYYVGASGRFEPDAMVLFGPTDSMMTLSADGTITLNTGKRTKERGAGSGALNIEANGGLHVYKYPVTINYNSAGEKEPNYAVGINCSGDYKEEVRGERHIRATKLYLDATDIIIRADASIHIQSGKKGKSGSIKMTAGRFEQDFINEDKILLGQKTQTGAGEDTSITFDPRATTTLTSAGTLQHRVTGDYKIVVAGIMATSIAGASPTGLSGVPLITDRTVGYSVDVLLGNTSIVNRVGSTEIHSLGLGKDQKYDPSKLLKIPVGAVNITALASAGISSKGGVSIKSGSIIDADIPAGLLMTSTGTLTATATGVFSATTAGAMNLIAVGEMLIKATGNVKVQGALIYLN